MPVFFQSGPAFESVSHEATLGEIENRARDDVRIGDDQLLLAGQERIPAESAA
jgi:hypothetical protein